MTVLFDQEDEYVRSVLDRAKVHGEITLAELEAIVEAGIEAKGGSLEAEDIANTIDALAVMGIEIDNGLTQEQEDAQFLRSLRARPGPLPSLTGQGYASLIRALEREKAAKDTPPDPNRPPAEEEAAAVRETLSQRTFIQNAFAHLGPRVRRTRKR